MIVLNEREGYTIQVRDALITILRASGGKVKLHIDTNGDSDTVRRSALLERVLMERGYQADGMYWLGKRGIVYTLRQALTREGLI